jgi:6-phosphogluconolactonase
MIPAAFSSSSVSSPAAAARPAARPAAAAPTACRRTPTTGSNKVRSSSSRSSLRAAASKNNGASATDEKFVLNVIPKSAWPNGVPPVMGAHLMASGVVAPVSTSRGAGGEEQGVPPHEFSYPQGEASTRVVVHATARAASLGLTRLVADAAKRAIAARGSFTLVLSGGSLIDALVPLAGGVGGGGGGAGASGSNDAPAAAAAAAAAAAESIDWSKVHVFWVDERVVPHDSPDSNAGAASKALLDRLPALPRQQVHAIAQGLNAAQAAAEYSGRLLGLPDSVLPRVSFASVMGGGGEGGAGGGQGAGALLPRFDLVLLGVGPDGHVASLFPNAAATAAQSPDTPWILSVTNSPKPPPERITMSLPVINAAQEVVVVALGPGKSEIVQRALEVQSLPGALPAQLVRPAASAGGALWLLDAGAAQQLDLGEWEGMKAFPRSEAGK